MGWNHLRIQKNHQYSTIQVSQTRATLETNWSETQKMWRENRGEKERERSWNIKIGHQINRWSKVEVVIRWVHSGQRSC